MGGEHQLHICATNIDASFFKDRNFEGERCSFLPGQAEEIVPIFQELAGILSVDKQGKPDYSPLLDQEVDVHTIALKATSAARRMSSSENLTYH